ncbi:MAG: N-acetyltransferase family protein [Holdemania massiliensis]
MTLTIRQAQPQDCATIGRFIRLIAEYEKMSDDVIWDDATLYDQLFVEHRAEVLLGSEGKRLSALPYISITSQPLSDQRSISGIYMLQEKRGRGYGKAFFKRLAEIAVERHCGRMEWVCLNWNTPSINFYKSLGAEGLTEWTTWRLSEDKIHQLAGL